MSLRRKHDKETWINMYTIPHKHQMEWLELNGDEVQAPLSVSGHYVISHRERQFNLSFRPPNHHEHVGCYETLDEAKKHAAIHRIWVSERDEKPKSASGFSGLMNCVDKEGYWK